MRAPKELVRLNLCTMTSKNLIIRAVSEIGTTDDRRQTSPATHQSMQGRAEREQHPMSVDRNALRGRSSAILVAALALVTLLTGIATLLPTQSSPTATLPIARSIEWGKLPLHFEPNMGQAAPAAHYVAHTPGGVFLFAQNEIVLQMGSGQQTAGGSSQAHRQKMDNETQSAASETQHSVARLSFVGANRQPTLSASHTLPGKVNYLIGNDPAAWRTDVPTYGSVTYNALYPGINLSYTGDGTRLKGTYTLAPNTDPSQIRWRYDVRNAECTVRSGGCGATQLSIDAAGNLRITQNNSTHERIANSPQSSLLVEQAPVAWQETDGVRVPVDARYTLAQDGTVGFALGAYNPALPLIIDPTLSYSTYFGGSGLDDAQAVAVDGLGNVYVTGYTESANFPTRDPYQPIYAGNSDAYVSKLSADGQTLLYSTYFGGSGSEQGYDITLGTDGHIYLTGVTYSTNFPLKDAFQPANAGTADAFVTKLAPSGNSLVFSTYLGASSLEFGLGIAVDSANNVYVAGDTSATDFPTVNPVQPALAGYQDIFVTKFNPQGSALIYSTYLGGSHHDGAAGIALVGDQVVVAGFARSTNFPVLNAIQPTHAGPRFDGFVTRYNSAGSAYLYSTYLGGEYWDEIHGVAAHPDGRVFVTGYAQSANFPTTANAYQPLFAGGPTDTFVTAINPAGNALLFSTYLGGATDGETGEDIAVDANGDVYVTGTTNSSDFPVLGAVQATNRGASDAFVTKLGSDGRTLLFSTYLGGTGDDMGFGIAPGLANNIHVVGKSISTDFTLANPLYSTNAGLFDAIIARIADVPGLTPTPIPTATHTAVSTPTPTACALTFTDVPSTHTFYAEIRCLACRGVLGGYADNTFRPQNNITRGQIAKVVSNAANFTEPVGGQTYQDVPPSQTFYEWIERLSGRGVMGGYPCGGVGEPCLPGNRPYFRPGADATRGQLSKIVANAAQISDPVGGQFYTDVPTTNPFYTEIMRLTGRGVMSGYPCGGVGEPCDTQNRPYFRWGNPVTRGQASKIVANTFYPGCQTP